MKRIILLTSLAIALLSLTGVAQKKSNETKSKDTIPTDIFGGLKFRSIGPAITSGRVVDFAVNPKDNSQYYVAVGCGGVWKTVNAGITWNPVFDHQQSFSIGCVAIDPNNTNVVWVGTGENNSQRSVSYGDGIYRSDDGGKTWKNMGLKKSEHLAKIIIDPNNSDIVYVAAQGPLWGAGGDRGLYKTTDGGKTWNAVLTISENTGVTDVVMDPRNSEVLYAASYQRRRHVFTLINGGPESAIYKSTDGGATWNKLTNGLPSVELGRIGLALSPVNPDKIYAIIEADEASQGIYASTDRGASWEKRSKYSSSNPQYYNEIFCDPKDENKIIALSTYTVVSEDGGKTFKTLGNKSRHVDDHALWIDPLNTKHILIGSDGGIYETYDNAENWDFKANLPVTQFYRVSVDNSLPFYYVYGGTQDNSSLGGPSQTTSSSGIANSDWFYTNGGDGFKSQVDPVNPDTIYAQSQYGYLVRYDRKTGERIGIQPQEPKGELPYRWNWDSPLIISPFLHTRLYFAANKLFKSDDCGNTWTVISQDLTRQIDRNKLPVMDKVWSVDAVAKNVSTSLYGNIVSLCESPLKQGMIYTGSDDGLINVTKDDGKNWTKIEKFTGVPETTYVSCILASQHDTNTVYASFDNHQNSDFIPYLLKSTDAGKTWTSIRGNLPEKEIVYTIAEDFKNPNLLFIGTEFGVYFTTDGGKKWIRLKSGLPTIAVRDIVIQKRESDLVIATFGRGFYILDDYSPLRFLNPDTLKKDAIIFPVRDALMFIQSTPWGGDGKASQGESFFTTDNPKPGAVFTYYIKEVPKTKKQIRQEKEKEFAKNKQPIPFPTAAELKAEDNQPETYLLFSVYDDQGNVVRNIKKAIAKGINRAVWDFRYPSTLPASSDSAGSAEPGILALPGNYKVALFISKDNEITELVPPQKFTIKPLNAYCLKTSDVLTLNTFLKEVAALRRVIYGALDKTNELGITIKTIDNALKLTAAATNDLTESAAKIESELREVIVALSGDQSLTKRNENAPTSIVSRMDGVVWGLWSTTSAPTQTQRDAVKIASEEFEVQLEKLKKLINVDLKALEDKMDALGCPYTPGRMPEWK